MKFQNRLIEDEIDFIGFHGQTIYHNPIGKIFLNKLGDGNLLSQLTKKRVVVYNFRQE